MSAIDAVSGIVGVIAIIMYFLRRKTWAERDAEAEQMKGNDVKPATAKFWLKVIRATGEIEITVTGGWAWFLMFVSVVGFVTLVKGCFPD